MMKQIFIYAITFILIIQTSTAKESHFKPLAAVPAAKALYGTASYYANNFIGKQTANGEIYQHQKMTAACNVLPLGTWIRVTNLSNGRSVLVKVNDRLHKRMTRVVDLSKTAAQKLGYIHGGLAKVKVEPLGKKKPVA